MKWMTAIVIGDSDDKTLYTKALYDAKKEAIERDCKVYLYKDKGSLIIAPDMVWGDDLLATCYPGGRTIVKEKLRKIIFGD